MQYIVDLGLITSRPQLRISNRIYQEVIPRELTWTVQVVLTQEQTWYLTADRRLDTLKLLAAFQQLFREHSEAWPQLLLQAFLQRIINGGGRMNREYGLGRKRTDFSSNGRSTNNKATTARCNALSSNSSYCEKDWKKHWPKDWNKPPIRRNIVTSTKHT